MVTEFVPSDPEKWLVFFGASKRPFGDNGGPAHKACWGAQGGRRVLLQKLGNVKRLEALWPEDLINECKRFLNKLAVIQCMCDGF